jgi:hypothetical protein
VNQLLPAEVTAALDAILSPQDPVHRVLLDQIPHLAVRERCGCGCGTAYFSIDTDAVVPAPTGAGTVVAASAELETETGDHPGEILVFAQGGYLSWIEVCSWTDDIKLTLAAAAQWLQTRS